MTAPEWLTRRDAQLQLSPDGSMWFVLWNGSPQYKLVPTPAEGGHTCAIVQAVNGKRIDKKPAIYRSRDEALHGGLDALRTALGW